MGHPSAVTPIVPASITICGALGRETLAALCELAIQAGAGLVLQPRPAVTEPRQIAGEVVSAPAPPKARRKVARRLTTRSHRPSPVAPAELLSKAAPAPRAPVRQAAEQRRWHILQTLERAGEAGLSFRALFARMKPHLTDAGGPAQQMDALRNAVYALKGKGLVERAIGQWLLTTAGKERMQYGKNGDPV